MNLSTILSTKTVKIGLKSLDKQGIIDELIAILHDAGAIKDVQAAKTAVMERENRLSTGMKFGIAIPHGKTQTVDRLVACVGISRMPVPFDSLDGEPARIFIMTLSPPEKTGPHLQFLAEVSQLFKDETRRERVVEAGSPAELLELITG
ncbi:MAG: PTS sucrose transporter subunit IIABC [Spirochaetes bacterium RIFOXYC1_FULL_54_7]|nr:MAG: PTS sucrose transporter subunit IIABC [Spirochaetes bacterium RIFOXYC1_FULL_54_7]